MPRAAPVEPVQPSITDRFDDVVVVDEGSDAADAAPALAGAALIVVSTPNLQHALDTDVVETISRTTVAPVLVLRADTDPSRSTPTTTSNLWPPPMDTDPGTQSPGRMNAAPDRHTSSRPAPSA